MPAGNFRGKKARALARKARRPNAVAAIVHYVHVLRSEHGSPQRSLDVFAAADKLGIPIVETNLRCHGILCRDGDSFEIRIDKTLSQEGKKFTVAHELGHYLLFREIPDAMQEASVCDDDIEEERLCDLAAAEMLMPFRSVRCELEMHTFGPGLVFDMARRCGVSRLAVMSRLRVVLQAELGTPIQLALWKLGRDSFFYRDWSAPSFQLTDAQSRFLQPSLRSSFEKERCVESRLQLGNASSVTVLSWRYGRADTVLSLLTRARLSVLSHLVKHSES